SAHSSTRREASAISQPRSASVAAIASASAPRPPMIKALFPSRRNRFCTNPGCKTSPLLTVRSPSKLPPFPHRLALLEERLHAFLRVLRVMHDVAGHRLQCDERVRVGIEPAIDGHLRHPHAERALVDERRAEILDELVELGLRRARID